VPRDRDVFVRGIREYLRPSFHPSQLDVDELAETYLAEVGLA
jgi:predicted metal-dependent hydrolase